MLLPFCFCHLSAKCTIIPKPEIRNPQAAKDLVHHCEYVLHLGELLSNWPTDKLTKAYHLFNMKVDSKIPKRNIVFPVSLLERRKLDTPSYTRTPGHEQSELLVMRYAN